MRAEQCLWTRESFNMNCLRGIADIRPKICLPKYIFSVEKLFFNHLNWLQIPYHWWIAASLISAFSFITHRPEKTTVARNIMSTSPSVSCQIVGNFSTSQNVLRAIGSSIRFVSLLRRIKVAARTKTHATTNKRRTSTTNDQSNKLTKRMFFFNWMESIPFDLCIFFVLFLPLPK